MKILICTGIFPPDIGGPALYAKNLRDEFFRAGHEVIVKTYRTERRLPLLFRHCFYFFRIIFNASGADLIIALDTFSVGWPAVCAAKMFEKKIILRVGGDFLWENYVEQSGRLVTLRGFYENFPELSLKQKVIFKLTKFVLKKALVVFSTEWQKKIWEKAYSLKQGKLFVIENFFGEKETGNKAETKSFLWAGRDIKLKNAGILKDVFDEINEERGDLRLEISPKISRDELMEKIKNCYAVILPSLSEVSPNFILDAIRFNKPFVCTKETGFYEKLKDVGFFVDPLDKGDIKEKITFLADDKNYEDYKNRLENFNFTHSWNQIAAEFLAVNSST